MRSQGLTHTECITWCSRCCGPWCRCGWPRRRCWAAPAPGAGCRWPGRAPGRGLLLLAAYCIYLVPATVCSLLLFWSLTIWLNINGCQNSRHCELNKLCFVLFNYRKLFLVRIVVTIVTLCLPPICYPTNPPFHCQSQNELIESTLLDLDTSMQIRSYLEGRLQSVHHSEPLEWW